MHYVCELYLILFSEYLGCSVIGSEVTPIFKLEKSGNKSRAVVHGEIDPDPGCQNALNIAITVTSWKDYSYQSISIGTNNDLYKTPTNKQHKLQVKLLSL